MIDPLAIQAPKTDAADAYLLASANVQANQSAPDAWLNEEVAPTKAPNAPIQEVPATETGDGQNWWTWMEGVRLPKWTSLGAVQSALSPTDKPDIITQATKPVAKDIVRGVVETPQAVARGVVGGTEQLFRTADDLANWLNDNVANLKIDIPGLPEVLGNPAAGTADALAGVKDTMAPRESVTGNLVEVVSQWIGSGAVVGKLAKAAGVTRPWLTRVIQNFGAGAAGFDPQSPRLANLLNEAAPNFITDFLKADSEDPALLARLKSGVEMAGLGEAATGVVKGIQLLRGWQKAAPQIANKGSVPIAGPEPGIPSVKPVEQAPVRDFLTVPGTGPAIQIDEGAAKAFASGPSGDSPVRINLLRIEGPQDVKDALARIDTLLPEHIPESLKSVESAAKMLGMQADDLAKGGVAGEAMSARQITAARILMRSAADDLVRIAQKASSIDATDLDRAAFNKAFAVSYALQQQVRQNTTAIARALSAHRIMAASDSDATKAVQELLGRMGGPDAATDMATKVAALANPEQAAEFVAKAGQATTRDQIMTIWVNTLLSNPTTHMVNVLDTMSASVMQVPEHWVASMLGKGVPAGEASARFYGMQKGILDAFRLAGKAWKTGETAFTSPTTRIETAIGDMGVDAGFNGKLADYLRMAIPTRALQAGDEFTKALNHRMELHGQAFRRAAEEGLNGAAAAKRASDLVNNPPPWLEKLAQDAARANTFNTPLTGGAASFQSFVDSLNVRVPGTETDVPLGRMLAATFIRTPYNILTWVAKRTPLGLLSKSTQEALEAGGPPRDLAISRMVIGSSILSTAADFVMQGRITGSGPNDPNMRRMMEATGWKPYSIKIGDEYYPYGRFGSVGGLIGFGATAAERLGEMYLRDPRTVDMDGEPVQASFAAAAVLSLAQVTQDKTYLTGISRLFGALADSERKGDAWMRSFVASWVPAISGAAERSTDDVRRRVDDLESALKARVPLLAQTLAPRLDIWGRPVPQDGGMWNMLSPVVASKAKPDPITDWMIENRLALAPVARHQSFTSLGGVSVPIELRPEDHNRLIALTGNEGKYFAGPTGRLGAHDYFNAIVAGVVPGVSKTWADASDEMRALMVRNIWQNAKTAAKAQFLSENNEVRNLLEVQTKDKAQKIMAPRSDVPVMQ